MIKYGFVAAAVLAMSTVSGCTSTSTITPEVGARTLARVAESEDPRFASARAFPEDLLAKGIRRCGISNLNDIIVSRQTGGSWNLFALDTYPGTPIYVLAGGKRSQADESRGVPVSEIMLAALKGREDVVVNWTEWPSGGDRQEIVVMPGFAEVYNQCQNFLSGKGGVEQFQN